MSSDFAEIRYTKVFECAEYEKCGTKILVRTIFDKKTYVFWGWGPPKSDRKLKLSDFDENSVPRGFRGCRFQKSHLFFMYNHFLRVYSGFFGSPVPLKKKLSKSKVTPILAKVG